MMRNLFPIFVAVILIGCGGGGGGNQAISELEAIAIAEKKLAEQSQVLVSKIAVNIESEESRASPFFQCSPSYVNLLEVSSTILILGGLDDFLNWALLYPGLTYQTRYQLGNLLDRSTLPSLVADTFMESAKPCSEAAVLNSQHNAQMAAINQILRVKDSLRRANLLAP